jgi:3-phenylpropionate/trans-cinnamate dioxygenase ferredoxin reductase subunit
MPTPDSVLSLGGGLAGATAAFALRDSGFAGRVTLVGEESVLPYERPPLSKGYLRGEEPIEKAQVRSSGDYATQGVELVAGRRALTLDPAVRRVVLDDGSELGYDSLLIATGSAPRHLGATAAYLPGVHYLRNVEDADAIRAASAEARSTVVVGGGWIGSEVAASLRQLGRDVTLVSDVERPLQRVLGPEIAEVYRDLHAEHGVHLRHGLVAAIDGEERAEAVVLSNRERIEADLVVVGIGAVPRLELATRGGLEVADGGIKVDAYLRTSVPNIYAAGDVAAAWHPRYERRVRVEHWDNASRQGKTAAANILGANEAYDRTPYFYSDQYDLGMEYRGLATSSDEVIVRGDLAAREFHAFWLSGGRVVAAMNANLWDDGDELARLVDTGARVDGARLADPLVPLAEAA